MRCFFPLITVVTAVTLANAQPAGTEAPERQEVRLTIRVVDSSTGAAIPNATLYVFSAEDSSVIADAPDTDSMGLSSAMLPRNSSYEVVAGASGYPVGHSGVVAVGTEPLAVTITLVTAATVFGHVVDADTKLPVARVPVQIWQLSFVRGRPQLVAAGQSIQTDAEGRFEAGSLPAGDYVVETYASSVQISSQASGPQYSRQVWPGGRDFADATPLSVPSGAIFDFGTILIEKRTLATVRFRIAGDCAGRRYDVRLVQTYAKGAMDRAQMQSVACDSASSFQQVPPGSYGLVATPSAPQVPASGHTADTWIEVTNSDIDVDLPLRSTPLTTIHGRVLSEIGEGGNAAAQGVPHASVRFLSAADARGLVAGVPLASDSAKADGEGWFDQQLYIPPGGKVAVRVEGLPANLYVDSLRYNGIRIHGDEFALNELAMTQDLDVICSDKFGTVSGEVVSKDSPVDVLLIPWPNDGASYPSGPIEVHADPNGRFSFSPVRPGHYKAVAVRSIDRQKFEAPFRLMRTLPNALEVEVAAGTNAVRIAKVE